MSISRHRLQRLTAIILTKNEEAHIAACLESLRWADSVMVFDSESTDRTVDIAKAHNAFTFSQPFINYTDQRNAALQTAMKHVPADWFLFIDADERTLPPLILEIRAAMDEPDKAGYWIPRHNVIFGKIARYAGWYPDYQLRLLRSGRARYDTTRAVHETVILDGTAGYLTQPLNHYNYTDTAQFARKQAHYTQLAAQELHHAGVRPKAWHSITAPVRHFIWRYITHSGWRGGWHGLRLSLLMAYWEGKKINLLAKMIRSSE